MTVEAHLATLLDELRAEHRNTARLLNALEHQIEITAQAGQPDYELILSIADYFCDYPDRCHHPKETAIFEQLRVEYPQEAEAVGDLGHEHVDTHERVHQFRQLIRGLLKEAIVPRSNVVDAARDFIEAERRHMHMEEERFFPVAEKCLRSEDWLRIHHDLTKDRDPAIFDQIEDEFGELRERLLEWEKDYITDA